MAKLSQVSKLDGIKSWSLTAYETCPGAIDPNTGGLVPACDSCYASLGFYSYPRPKAVRAFNKEDWKRAEWVDEMVAQLETERYFRWFDSGDMYSMELAEKILDIMTRTPDTKHWLPTRQYKFTKFAPILAKMDALPNVKVRRSSDSVLGEFTPGLHGSTIIEKGSVAPSGVVACNSPKNAGKCNGCRSCWDKTVDVIAYEGHGNKFKRVIRIAKAAK